MIDEQLAKIGRTQDQILAAIKKGRKIPLQPRNEAEAHDKALQEKTAEGLGVDSDEYRRWCAGDDLPHIRDAVLKSK